MPGCGQSWKRTLRWPLETRKPWRARLHYGNSQSSETRLPQPHSLNTATGNKPGQLVFLVPVGMASGEHSVCTGALGCRVPSHSEAPSPRRSAGFIPPAQRGLTEPRLMFWRFSLPRTQLDHLT